MLFQRRTSFLSASGQENRKDEAVTATESMWATILKFCILVSLSLVTNKKKFIFSLGSGDPIFFLWAGASWVRPFMHLLVSV